MIDDQLISTPVVEELMDTHAQEIKCPQELDLLVIDSDTHYGLAICAEGILDTVIKVK